jgi:hypothetical protein
VKEIWGKGKKKFSTCKIFFEKNFFLADGALAPTLLHGGCILPLPETLRKSTGGAAQGLRRSNTFAIFGGKQNYQQPRHDRHVPQHLRACRGRV